MDVASVWESWRAATCMPDGCFCEGVRDGWVRQPANAWSSLGFVLAAVWTAARRVGPGLRGLQTAFVVGAALVGFGSAFYHASLSFVGQFWDVLGMYLLSGLVLLRRIAKGPQFAQSYALLIAVLAVLLWFVPELRRWLFALVLLGGIALELRYLQRKPDIQAPLFWAGLGLFALAFGVWILDNTGAVCAPSSLLQGHALWHLLGAVATALLFAYYASERLEPARSA